MNTKILSNRAMGVIDQYRHFKVGNAVCSVPYFNNKVTRNRAALRTYIGKGSPREIFEEVQTLAVKNHTDLNSFTNDSLKKFLVANNLGIDCSGFAYYILQAESIERGRGLLDKHLHFTSCHGLIGKIRSTLRPVENCDVATFAHDKNSRPIETKDVVVGDIIIAKTNGSDGTERDHIQIIYQIEYQNFLPVKIHYSQAIARPEDGIYGTGVKQGEIVIRDISKPIAGLRRLNWF